MAGIAFLLACGWVCIAKAAAPEAQPTRVVAYVAGWSMPPAIAAEKLTHINFAFARISSDGTVALENPGFPKALKSLVALKARNAGLKVILSIGGWQADGFSDAALTEESRNRFAASAVDLLHRYELDGLDIDWEYPGQGVAGIKFRPEDKQNFTQLLKTLRTHLDRASDADHRTGRDRYLLTVASADREYFEHTEMDKLHVYLDWLNVMTYDFFNSLTSTTGHHGGLFASEYSAAGDRNGDASIKQHLAAAIPPGKLVLGAAFYGRSFTGVNPDHNGRNQRYRKYGGEYSYADLKERLIDRRSFVRYWDDRAQVPYLWNDATDTFISYEDPQSIGAKARYVQEHHLGGIMFWELSQDRDGDLLEAIVNSLGSAP